MKGLELQNAVGSLFQKAGFSNRNDVHFVRASQSATSEKLHFLSFNQKFFNGRTTKGALVPHKVPVLAYLLHKKIGLGIINSQFSLKTLCNAGSESSDIAANVSSRNTLEVREAETQVAGAQSAVEREIEGANSGVKPKSLGSAQLNRWARMRQLRSGPSRSKASTIKVERATDEPRDVQVQTRPSLVEAEEDPADLGSGALDGGDPLGESKGIYIISDGTGWTADNAVQAALGQFEHCFVDRGCPVHTHLYSQVHEVERLLEIIRAAGEDSASLVVYTLAEPAMRDAAMRACQVMKVPFVDMMGTLISAVESHLGAAPVGLPRGAPGRRSQLTQQYFKRIEAVEFTIRQDDGALPRNLKSADLVLVGVSRTSKTPLSTYLAQKGYKVANVPLVLGIPPPKELYEIDQGKIFGLTISASTLHAIRRSRYNHLGLNTLPNEPAALDSNETRSSPRYHDPDLIRRELEYGHQLFRENPRWYVVDVSGRAIEETAAMILRAYHEKADHKRMPRISRRY